MTKILSTGAVGIVAAGCLMQFAEAFPGYAGFFPNGNNVFFCDGTAAPGVGHEALAGNGPRNPFGLLYEGTAVNGGTPPLGWQAICNQDSDNDGMTNGEELGDPDCLWTGPANNSILGDVLGHPGFNCESLTTPSLTAATASHGALMLFAWLLFAPAGILTAIFNKTRKAPMVKKWFMVHQALLTTTVFLTLIAFFIMVNQQGFILPTSHSKLGFTVVIFAILQPLSGVVRPHIVPGEPKSFIRLAWEYGHQLAGRLIVILATAAAILGVGLAGGALRQIEAAEAIQITIAVLFSLASAGLIAYVVFLRPDEREVVPPSEKPREDKIPDPESQTQTSNQAQAVSAKAEKAEQPVPAQEQQAQQQQAQAQQAQVQQQHPQPTAPSTTTSGSETTVNTESSNVTGATTAVPTTNTEGTEKTQQTNVTQG